MTAEQKSPWIWSELSGNLPRVLIVDNDKILLDMLNFALSEFGLLVTTSDNAADAIKQCMFNAFPYIITDYDMPGMNGVELTRRLRKRFPLAIIIGMSGSDRNIEFLSAGANDFLQKPFPALALATIVDRREVQQQ